MTTLAAFLRAVNVGRRIASMAKVADVCRSLAYADGGNGRQPYDLDAKNYS